VARRFPNLPFGPMALRPLLRHLRRQGESIVAWGIASERLTASAAFFRAAVAMLPGVGHVLLAATGAAGGPPRRLVILTDRRVLVFATRRGEMPQPHRVSQPAAALDSPSPDRLGGALIAAIDVARLTVTVGSLGTHFALAQDGDTLFAGTIDARQSPVTARLCLGLATMDPRRATDLTTSPHDPERPRAAPARRAPDSDNTKSSPKSTLHTILPARGRHSRQLG